MSGRIFGCFGSRGLGWMVFVGVRQSGVCLGGFSCVFHSELGGFHSNFAVLRLDVAVSIRIAGGCRGVLCAVFLGGLSSWAALLVGARFRFPPRSLSLSLSLSLSGCFLRVCMLC
jgi:hypothetical protein